MIELNGMELTIEQVIAVARHNEQVRISEPAKEKINRARAYVDEKLAQRAVIYGLTTGFGKFSDTFVPEQETAALQRNLIISHACGMGAPLPREVVRGAMLLRCNALARGNSGIRLSTLETLLAMLNRGVHPVIPEKGSLGASGDLAPLAHIVLVMLGEGEATGFDSWDMEYPGERFEDGFDLGLGEAPNETAAKWLSGHPCGYVVKRNAYLGDGAKLPDGTYLSPVDSGVEETDGQTVRAYYEVELPEGYQPGGTVDFVLTVIISDTIYVQNENGLYEATLMDGAAMLDVPFSVPATGNIRMLKGEGMADGYAAHAALALSDVDISGEVRIDAPTDYAPQGYALLADGVTYPNLNEWMEYDGQTHVIHLRFDVPQTTDGLALVPIDPAYADEAIELN